MARWAMVIDLDRCTACGGCMDACHQENNLPVAGERETTVHSRGFYWLRLRSELAGPREDVKLRFLPHLCFHCDDPPCVRVCPVHATYLSDEGIVGQIYARCIGCRYCMAACPFSAKVFNWYAPRWPGDLAKRANPDVSLRPKGVVEKCTFCHHRINLAREQARVEGRVLHEGDVVPACAESCPTRAIVFGDLEEPGSRVSQLVHDVRAFRVNEDLGTRPKVYYLAERG